MHEYKFYHIKRVVLETSKMSAITIIYTLAYT